MSTDLMKLDGAEVATRDAANHDELAYIQRLGKLLAASGYFADSREMAQAAVKVMAGRELGIPAIASMVGINIIKGKVALGVHLIASRVRAHGYDYEVQQLTDTGCVLIFLGKPHEVSGKRKHLGTSAFNKADAEAAGVYSDMYRKYPRNMYYSRAMSNGAKWFTPEIFGGAPVYTPDELGAEVDGAGEMVQPEETQEQVAERRIAEERARAAEPPRKPPASDKPQREDVPDYIRNLWARMTKVSEICAVFKQLKASLSSEDEYYAILKRHGMTHSNDCKTVGMEVSRRCAQELFEAARKWVAEQEAMAMLPDSQEEPQDVAVQGV